MPHLTFFSILILFLFNGHFCSGQADTLNKFNAKNKKTGYWKVYLDEKADPVDSLKMACFTGLELWDNGKRVFKYYKHGWKYSKMTFDGTLPKKGEPKLISGTFRWFNSKGKVDIEEVYGNGQPVFMKYFTMPINKTDSLPFLFLDLDFTKKYNNIPGTYFYQEHSINKVNEYWFRKGKRGWRVYKIKK